MRVRKGKAKTAAKPKRKKGHVVRLTPELWTIVELERRGKETTPSVLRRLLDLTGVVNYVLPSDMYETPADARGAAVLRAVRRKEKRIERPVPVRKAE